MRAMDGVLLLQLQLMMRCHVCCVVAPKITRPPLSAHVTEGHDAMFDCQLSATPWPVTVVTWTFNDQPISVSTWSLSHSVIKSPHSRSHRPLATFFSCNREPVSIELHIDCVKLNPLAKYLGQR